MHVLKRFLGGRSMSQAVANAASGSVGGRRGVGRRGAARVVAVLSVILLAAAEAPGQAPDDPRDAKVWHFTNYLSGTAPEVRRNLNRDVEHFLRVRARIRTGIATGT